MDARSLRRYIDLVGAPITEAEDSMSLSKIDARRWLRMARGGRSVLPPWMRLYGMINHLNNLYGDGEEEIGALIFPSRGTVIDRAPGLDPVRVVVDLHMPFAAPGMGDRPTRENAMSMTGNIQLVVQYHDGLDTSASLITGDDPSVNGWATKTISSALGNVGPLPTDGEFIADGLVGIEYHSDGIVDAIKDDIERHWEVFLLMRTEPDTFEEIVRIQFGRGRP